MRTVTRLSIAPVRSLALVHPASIDLTPTGVLEDRRFYLVDDDGRLVDRLVVGELVQVAAHTDPEATMLRLVFPDGLELDGDVVLGEPIETSMYGRTAIGRLVVGPWAEALASIAGRVVRLVRCDRPGGTRRGNPASLIGRGSLEELARRAGIPSIDPRRFRMLVELDGTAPHEEDDWIGRRIALGDAVLRVTDRDARCAITTQDPDTGRRDLDTLRAIIGYRGLLPNAAGAPKAMFGVLADVERPGQVRLGDQVVPLD